MFFYLQNQIAVCKRKRMVETNNSTQATDGQTQFGNSRQLDPSDCIFVFKDTQSDYEEPPSDEEVSSFLLLHFINIA